MELVKKNLENATIICDYIIAEQIEINIQSSTKERYQSSQTRSWSDGRGKDSKNIVNSQR